MFARTRTFIKSRGQPPQERERTIPERLADQSELIDKLRATINALETDIRRLRDDLGSSDVREKERGEAIATLRHDLEPLRTLPQALSEKDAQISSIQTSLTPLHRRAGEQEREIAALAKLLADVRRTIAPFEQRITELDARLAEGRALTSQHANALAELEPLRSLPETVAEQEAGIEGLHTSLLQLEHHSAEHDDTLRRLDHEQSAHSQALSEQATALATLRGEVQPLRALPAQLAKEHESVERLGTQLPALADRVDGQEGELRRLHGQIDALAARGDGVDHTLAGLSAQVEPLRVLPTLVDQLREALPRLEQRVSAQGQDVVELHAGLDAARAVQEHHSADLASLAAELDPLRPLPSQLFELREMMPPLEQRMSEQEIQLQRLEYETTQTSAEQAQGMQGHADEISTLKSELEPLRGLPEQVGQCWELADRLRGTTTTLERRISEQDRESKRLQEELSAQKTGADEHAQAIAAVTGELEALRPLPDKLAEQASAIDGLHETLAPLDHRIMQQEQLAQEHAETGKAHEATIQGQAEALAARASDVDMLRAELSLVRQVQDQISSDLQDEQSLAHHQAQTIEEQEAQIHELVSSGTELIAQVKQQEEQMSALREALSAAEMKLNSQAEFSSTLQKKLSALEARFAPPTPPAPRDSSAESDGQPRPTERPRTPRRQPTQPLPWYMQRYSTTGSTSNSSNGTPRM
ncbi:hypothetical protein AURDEDRAFT_178906 [Auricularia subglabra TFB-10046 SS5]|nr:hypothetical protein AURDEDRAFT_178906 [Auricularia subglabra TFB-10046 SS5]